MALTEEENKVREVLIKYARNESLKPLYYSSLLKESDSKLDMSKPNDRKRLGNLLGNISEEEVLAGRPMLSSIVVNKDYSPSEGFFKMAEYLHLIKSDKMDFWKDEYNRTYEYWKNN